MNETENAHTHARNTTLNCESGMNVQKPFKSYLSVAWSQCSFFSAACLPVLPVWQTASVLCASFCFHPSHFFPLTRKWANYIQWNLCLHLWCRNFNTLNTAYNWTVCVRERERVRNTIVEKKNDSNEIDRT